MDSWIRWSGVSCGKIPKPPRRAIVSTMRRPVTPFMFDETIGIEVPVPSVEEISTSIRELICEKDGTRKTSEYVRSVVTGLRKRILPSCQLFINLPHYTRETWTTLSGLFFARSQSMRNQMYFVAIPAAVSL